MQSGVCLQSSPPSSLLFTDTSQNGRRADLEELSIVGEVDKPGVLSLCQYIGNEVGLLSPLGFPSSDLWPLGPDDQQFVIGGIEYCAWSSWAGDCFSVSSPVKYNRS